MARKIIDAKTDKTVKQDAEERDVEPYRQCPICWGGLRGVGLKNGFHAMKSTQYLRCGTCGHSWSAVVKVVVESVNPNLPDGEAEKLFS